MSRHYLVTAFACAALLVVGGARADEPKRMSGQGGFPLNESVTSMWGAIDEPVSQDRPKPLTFMIYFVGTPGWHKAKWSFSADLAKDPAFIEFAGPVVLRAEFDRTSQRLRVFGQEFAITDSNVFLVQSVDDAAHRRVVAIGRVDLSIPADANPAAYVLQRFESIRNVVFPKGK